MSSTHIGWAGLAASLVLVAIAVGLSGWQRLHLSRSILWACARAAVQLFLVGWALKLVLDPGASVAWAWLWVAVMVVFSGITIRNRAPEVPGILGLGTLAMLTRGGRQPLGRSSASGCSLSRAARSCRWRG